MTTAQRQKRRAKRQKSRLLTQEPELLRSDIALSDDGLGVDKENAVINGYVVAQMGRFKSEGRGQFNEAGLQKLVELGNASDRGIRSRFGHPNQSDDGLGKYLGRAKNFRLEGDRVKADMHLNATALQEPPQGGRPLGEYVMHLADTDPGAFSSSIVVAADKEEIDGQPPVWMPTHLYASDVVDTGDAVDDFMSADFLADLPSGAVYEATKLIERQFAGQPRDVVEARLRAFTDKFLDRQFGPIVTTTVLEEDMATEDNARLDSLEEQLTANQTQLSAIGTIVENLSNVILEDREAAKKRDALAARSTKITALCAQCGVDAQQASEWIADESLSVDDVKDRLLAQKFEESKPAGDGGGMETPTGDEQLSQEYDLHASDHRALGIKKEDWIAQRKKELAGEQDEFEYMSPEWADSLQS